VVIFSGIMNIFGQLIIGPPGSGKTTYCHAVGKFLESIGRKVAIVNVGEKINHHCYFISVFIILVCF
jgi:molybdopterin-guanine dinucleotide biosynthesis protein